MSRRQSVPSSIFYRRADPMPPLFPEPWDTVLCDVERISTTQVALRSATAVAAAQYRAVVTGR